MTDFISCVFEGWIFGHCHWAGPIWHVYHVQSYCSIKRAPIWYFFSSSLPAVCSCSIKWVPILFFHPIPICSTCAVSRSNLGFSGSEKAKLERVFMTLGSIPPGPVTRAEKTELEGKRLKMPKFRLAKAPDVNPYFRDFRDVKLNFVWNYENRPKHPELI